jgi:hypothetical protein
MSQIYGMIKNPTSVKEIIRCQNPAAISSPRFPPSLLDTYAGKDYQIALVENQERLETVRGTVIGTLLK